MVEAEAIGVSYCDNAADQDLAIAKNGRCDELGIWDPSEVAPPEDSTERGGSDAGHCSADRVGEARADSSC